MSISKGKEQTSHKTYIGTGNFAEVLKKCAECAEICLLCLTQFSIYWKALERAKFMVSYILGKRSKPKKLTPVWRRRSGLSWDGITATRFWVSVSKRSYTVCCKYFHPSN